MTQPNGDEREAVKKSTASMRRKKQREHEAGYRRASIALSPTSLDVVERIRANFGLPSREATINVVLEMIHSDMFLWHEFMSHRPVSSSAATMRRPGQSVAALP
jgi:hypothetical protein